MSIEEIKSALLALVDEANKLDEQELDTVPYSTIKVKKGKTRNFDRLAGYYYQATNNINLSDTSDVDYSKIVFDSLSEEIRESKISYYTAKAESVLDATKDARERFFELTKTLNTLKLNGETLSKQISRKQLSELQNLSGLNPELQANLTALLTGISDELTNINDNIQSVKSNLSSTAVEINKAFAKALLEQKDHLEEKFLTAPKVETPSFANNGVAVLASDLEEYNAILELISIRSKIDYNQDLELIDGIFCINPENKDHTVELFAKIEILKLFTKPAPTPIIESKEEKDLTPEAEKANLNNKLIIIIDERITELLETAKNMPKDYKKTAHGKIANSNYPEYNRLIELKNILERGVTTPDYEKIWDIAYISKEGNDLEFFKSLMHSLKIFNDYDPFVSKRKENEEVIKGILEYIENLASAALKNTSNGNLPWRETKKLDDQVWIVDKKDLREVNNLIKIVNILRDTKNIKEDDNLEKVLGIGYVKKDNIPLFQTFVKATKYFADKMVKPVKEPELIPSAKNAEYIAKYSARIKELNQSVQEQKSDKKTAHVLKLLMNSIDILPEDVPEAELLSKLIGYLQAEKKSTNLTRHNDVILDNDDVEKYDAALKQLEEITNQRSIPAKLNAALIASIKEKIRTLAPDSPLVGLYNSQINILEEVDESKDEITTVNNAKISKRYEKLYNRLLTEIASLVEPQINYSDYTSEIASEENILKTLDAQNDKEEIALTKKVIECLKNNQINEEYHQAKEKLAAIRDQKDFNSLNKDLKEKIEKEHKMLDSTTCPDPNIEYQLSQLLEEQHSILNDYPTDKLWGKHDIRIEEQQFSLAATPENYLKFAKNLDEIASLKAKIVEMKDAKLDPTINDAKILAYQKRIMELENEAKAANNSKELITIGTHTILKDDERELNTIIELIEYLNYAKKASDLKQVDDVVISASDEGIYNLTLADLERITKNKSINQDLIASVKAQIAVFPADLTDKESELEGLLTDQLELLLDAKNSDILVTTSDSAKISIENESKYEIILTKIKSLSVTEIALNNDINNDKIREFTQRLDDLIAKAKGASEYETALISGQNVRVLNEDSPEAETLNKIIDILFKAKTSTNLKTYNDIKIDEGNVEDYLELLNKLNEITLQKKKESAKIPEGNAAKIAELEKRIGIILTESCNTQSPERTNDDNIVDSLYTNEYNILIEKIEILRNAATSNNLIKLSDGTVISSELEQHYNELEEKLAEVEIEQEEETGLFRKMGQAIKKFWRNSPYRTDSKFNDAKYFEQEIEQKALEEEALESIVHIEKPDDQPKETKKLIIDLLSKISETLSDNREFVANAETKEVLEANLENLFAQKNKMNSALQNVYDLIESADLSRLAKRSLSKKADKLNDEFYNYGTYLGEAYESLKKQAASPLKDPFENDTEVPTVVANDEIANIEASLVNLRTSEEIENLMQSVQDLISTKEETQKLAKLKGKALEQSQKEVNRLIAIYNDLNNRLSNYNPEPVASPAESRIGELEARKAEAERKINEIIRTQDEKRLDELSELTEEIKKIEEELYNLTGNVQRR